MLDFVSLAQECAPHVPHQMLAAIVKTESAFRPLAIGVNGGNRLARQPANKPEAVATAKWLIDRGYDIDLGLGQINLRNLAKVGLTVEDAFEPCPNIRAVAKIYGANLKWAQGAGKSGDAAVLAALSAYNTGNFTGGLRNGYVQRVVSNHSGAMAVATQAPGDAPPIPLIRQGKAGRGVAPGGAMMPTPMPPATRGRPQEFRLSPADPDEMDPGVYAPISRTDRPGRGSMVY